MTKEEAIQLAIQYQKEHHQSVKISKVHWIDQSKIDALVDWAKWAGESSVDTWPEWMRPLAHWVVLFDRELDMVPQHYAIAVYDDGVVFESPAL